MEVGCDGAAAVVATVEFEVLCVLWLLLVLLCTVEQPVAMVCVQLMPESLRVQRGGGHVNSRGFTLGNAIFNAGNGQGQVGHAVNDFVCACRFQQVHCG